MLISSILRLGVRFQYFLNRFPVVFIIQLWVQFSWYVLFIKCSGILSLVYLLVIYDAHSVTFLVPQCGIAIFLFLE